jgi:hypothetical protein
LKSHSCIFTENGRLFPAPFIITILYEEQISQLTMHISHAMMLILRRSY